MSFWCCKVGLIIQNHLVLLFISLFCRLLWVIVILFQRWKSSDRFDRPRTRNFVIRQLCRTFSILCFRAHFKKDYRRWSGFLGILRSDWNLPWFFSLQLFWYFMLFSFEQLRLLSFRNERTNQPLISSFLRIILRATFKFFIE
jgi:hypothetical protein